ncbi:MAG: glycoside hydrolase family 127 protein, partial [Clostridiales bacterium]|nr:glycoside hydrolase family 127 protein [Clostridiales bacterium]
MKNIPFRAITLGGGFWRARYELNRDVSVKSVYARFEETGRFDALRFNYDGTRPLHFFYDSDAAKWIEAVAYLIEKDRHGYADYEKIIDDLVLSMEKHQDKTGYLNSYFQQKEPQRIFADRDKHELYCAGHLIEAAVAYYAATGKDRFLTVMKRCIDNIERAFVTEKTAKFFSPGHEELELALLRLYEATGEERYLKLAAHFLLIRGVNAEAGYQLGNAAYAQNNAPVY